MSLLFAAFGGIVAALLESTVIPYLRIGDAQPHLLFVLAIIVTVVGGFDRGLVFAFVGGLFLDVFTQRPLGISAFALLLSVGGVALLSRVMSRARPLVADRCDRLVEPRVLDVTVRHLLSAPRGRRIEQRREPVSAVDRV